ncbi:MAG: aldo/keto reductase [Chloroflexi bacterium]|nr:aldo/keto reductase [Chloroflexota bacterium]
MSRRQFVGTAAALGLSAVAAGCGLKLPFELFGRPSSVKKVNGLEYRTLGKTGLEVALLGLGGFHFIERDAALTKQIVSRYIELGGNYVETAYSYGNGDSEIKVGAALQGLRDKVVLATKVGARDKAGAAKLLETSLANLKTDHIDIWFMHAVQSPQELDQLLADDGAIMAAEEARAAGKVRFIGISGHGWADVLLDGLKRYPFDVVMHNFNYLDRFNFPSSEQELLPYAVEHEIGIVGMKAVGDGLLYRSPEPALRYTFGLPLSTMVAGMNTLEFLDGDMAVAKNYQPMSAAEQERLFADAPELGNYVCRQCGKCLPNERNVPIPTIFQLEGMLDRQMIDITNRDAAETNLRYQLAYWFALGDVAKERYAALAVNKDDFASCAAVEPNCPYKLPIVRKLEYVDAKMTA